MQSRFMVHRIFFSWVEPNKLVLPCKVFLVGKVSPLLCMADMKGAGVRVSGQGCQKTTGVTGCLGRELLVWCLLFYVSVFKD